MKPKPINTEAIRVRDWSQYRNEAAELDAKLARIMIKPKEGKKK